MVSCRAHKSACPSFAPVVHISMHRQKALKKAPGTYIGLTLRHLGFPLHLYVLLLVDVCDAHWHRDEHKSGGDYPRGLAAEDEAGAQPRASRRKVLLDVAARRWRDDVL